MTHQPTHNVVYLRLPDRAHETVQMSVNEDIAVALDLLEATLTQACGLACEDGVLMAVCLDNRLFERIATLGHAVMECEPDNDFEECHG